MTIRYGERKGANTLIFLVIAILVSNIIYTVVEGSSSENQQKPNGSESNGNDNKEEEQNGAESGNGSSGTENKQYQNGTGSNNESSDEEEKQQQNEKQGGERNPSDNGSHYGWENLKENYQLPGYRAEIWQGVENGTVIMETTLTKNGDQIVKENDHYHSGMWLNLEEAKVNKVRVKVSAEFNEGKVVVINIDVDILKFTKLDDIKVSFDGETIEMGTTNEVLEAMGSNPQYVVALDSEGAQFLVYIPHFSEHIIEIESLVDLAEKKIFSSTNYMVMAFAVLILICLSSYIYKIGKGRA